MILACLAGEGVCVGQLSRAVPGAIDSIKAFQMIVRRSVRGERGRPTFLRGTSWHFLGSTFSTVSLTSTSKDSTHRHIEQDIIRNTTTICAYIQYRPCLPQPSSFPHLPRQLPTIELSLLLSISPQTPPSLSRSASLPVSVRLPKL